MDEADLAEIDKLQDRDRIFHERSELRKKDYEKTKAAKDEDAYMADDENRVPGVATSSGRARKSVAKGRVGVEDVPSHGMAVQLKAPPGHFPQMCLIIVMDGRLPLNICDDGVDGPALYW